MDDGDHATVMAVIDENLIIVTLSSTSRRPNPSGPGNILRKFDAFIFVGGTQVLM